jgi:hypothetical protein
MDGYQSLPIAEAARIGDVFVTVTGNRDAITLDHLQAMKPGTVTGRSATPIAYTRVVCAVDLQTHRPPAERIPQP